MSAAEFEDHWQDYQHSPWGERRGDIQAALISQTIANYAGKVRKDAAPIKDFLLDFDREPTPDAEPDPAAFFGPFVS